jgi:hypothetical protein
MHKEIKGIRRKAASYGEVRQPVYERHKVGIEA